MKAWGQRRAKSAAPLPRAVVVSKTAPRARRLRQPPARAAAERRADAAADRAVRGERNIAADVGTAGVARANVAGSVGAALASDLLAAFERAFGADLRAVRVHTDAAAAAVARAAGARAFTAGRDIYFDLAHHELRGERGRWLLAHELAHVLQQSARRGTDGRPRATAQAGTEEVQYKTVKPEDEVVESIERAGWFADPSTSYADIKDAYSNVTGIASHATAIEGIIGATPGDPKSLTSTQRKGLRSAVEALAGSVSEPVLSYLVDVLKWAGEHKTANQLVLAHRELPTAFRSRAFYEYVRGRSLAWLPAQVKTDATCKTYFPDALVKVYGDFFLWPATERKWSKESEAFLKATGDRLQSIADTVGPKANELTIAALFATNLLEQYRRDALTALVTAYDKRHANLVDTYYEVADRFGRVKNPDDELVGTKALEIAQLFAVVFPEVQKRAAKAAALWQRISKLHTKVEGEKEGGDELGGRTADELKSLAKSIKAGKRFAKLQTTLVSVAKVMLARPGGEAAAIPKFAAAVKRQREVVASLIATYVDALKQAAAKDADETPEALQLGLAIYYLFQVDYALDRYDRSADEKLSGKPEHLADVRLATQIRVARELNAIQRRLDLSELRHETDAFITAEPHLALLDPWVEDTKANSGEIDQYALVRDLGGDIAGWKNLHITAELLANYVYGAYYDRLAQQLSSALAMRGSDYTIPLSKLSLLAEARQNIKDAPRPRRFVMKHWEFSDPAEAAVAVSKPAAATASATPQPTPLTFGEKVFKHQRTADARTKYQLATEMSLTRSSRPRQDAPFPLWFIPRFDELVTLIATDELVKQVAEWWKAANKKEPLPDAKKEWHRWLMALDEMAGGLTDPAAQQRLVAGSSGVTQKDYENARDKAFVQGRLATTHDRRMMVDEIIAPLWRKFDRNKPTTFDSADQAFMRMRDFVRLVFPDTDRAIQVTALVLELAPDLAQAIGKKSRFWGLSKSRIAPNLRVVGELMPLAAGALAEFYRKPRAIMEVKRDDLTVKDYVGRANTLDVLVDQMRDSMIERQEELGFSADAKKQQVRELYLGGKVDKGKFFADVTGTNYFFTKIHTSFTFHPAHAGYFEWDVNFSGQKKGSGEPQLLDEHGKDIPLDGRPLLQFSILDKDAGSKKDGSSNVYDVSAKKDDFRTLNALSMALGDAAGFAMIAAVGVLLEDVVNIVLDVLEFIPGVGQAIMAARFVVAMLDFITSDEFATVMDALSTKGLAVFPELFDQIKSLVKPAELLSVLLFGVDFVTAPPQKATPPATPKPSTDTTKSGAWQKLGRAIRAIFMIGKRLWTRFKRLIKWVQYPFRAAQMWVLEHPGVALLLGTIVDNYDTIKAITLRMVMGPETTDKDEQESGPSFKQIVASATDTVAERAQGTVEELSNLELPGKIIDMGTIVEWMIDMVVNTLGGKYKKGIKIVRYALDKLGLSKRIDDAIGGVFSKALGSNEPNKIWQSKIRPPIENKFDNVRDELVGSLVTQLNKVPFLDNKVKEPEKHKISIEFDDSDEFDDAETYPAEHEHALASSGAMPAVAGGDELTDALRTPAERGLGHDFAHVRLHRGADAERVTGRLGAEGVTVGSHVYLRPGLSPDGGLGREVLHHELAHVIQQTGPRPLGGAHSSQPATGAAGRGVAFDPARESAADRAASRAASATHATVPADVGGRSAGLQPFIGDDFLVKFMSNLTRGQGIELAEKMAERKQQLGAQSLRADPNAVAISTALKTGILTALTGPTATYRAPFDKARTEIVKLISGHQTKIDRILPEIMEIAALVVPGHKSGDTPPPDVWYLAPRRLELALKRYLYAELGLGFDIELQEKAMREMVGAKKRPVLDVANPFKSATLMYVHLPMVDEKDAKGAAALWDLIVKNTKPNGYSAAKHDLYVAATKLIVMRYGPRPDLYEVGAPKLQLTSRFAGSVASLAGRIADMLKKTPVWPSPTDYANPHGAGQLGLRYGTYKQQTSGNTEEERESHHITQFLLVEYFSNHNTKKPFPHAGAESDLYPGLSPVKSEAIDSITDSNNKTITVGSWYKGHGGAMPTIYLSTYTHQSGIHYKRSEPDDMPGRSSQGNTLQNLFVDRMRGKLGRADADLLLGDSPTALKTLKDLRAAFDDNTTGAGLQTTTRKRFRDAVYAAARAGYQDMITDMYPKLGTALHDHEVRYYNAIAERKGMTDRITKAQTTDALIAAQTGNKKDFGGPSGFGP